MTSSRRRYGFSLVEMMVSLAILMLVTVYLTDMLTKQSRAYEVVDQVTEVQQNLRAIADLVEREMRVTGYLVPEAASICGIDAVNGPDTLFLSDSLALTLMDNFVNDYNLYARIAPGSFTNTLSPPPGAAEAVTVDNLILDNVAAYDVSIPTDGTNDSDFRVGAGVIVIDRNNTSRGSACGIVQGIPLPGSTLNVNFMTTLAPTLPDEDLVAVPANVYQVIDTGAPGPQNLQLFRNGLLLADDVEDMQFALFYDDVGAANDTIEVGEYYGSGGAGEFNYVSSQRDNTLLREIRINFVLRSHNPDREFGTAANPAGQFQVTENRVAPAPLRDQFRRRVHTAAVRPRNVGLRGVGG